MLVVGAGGLGLPAARVLTEAGVGHLRIADDDVVDESNLHRQVLYDDEDIGAAKAPRAAIRLEELARRVGSSTAVEPREQRFLPRSAAELLADVDLVVEGSDNHATKFLVADACALAGVPVVHAGAIRWGGWALSVTAEHGSCLRCVFEDVPAGPVATCATAGVVGPAVGLLGAVQGWLALSRLRGRTRSSLLVHYDGLRARLRHHRPPSRQACPHARGVINDLDPERYRSGCRS